ncbi:MAG: ABC transporter permease [Chlamydiae bacterium]|nr:ABC transporter permease [Chlamydiota bacterium]
MKKIECSLFPSKFLCRKLLCLWSVRLALAILITLSLFVLLGPYFSSNDPFAIHLSLKNSPPSAQCWFGTDELGRDLWIRSAQGGRISLSIACLSTLLDASIGLLFSSIAVCRGGKAASFFLRVCDLFQSIPYLLLVMLVTLILTPGFKTTLLAMTLTGWIPIARAARLQLLHVQKEEYVLSARALGASRLHILFWHLLPNALGPISASILLCVPNALFTEAFLSFLGLGLQAPSASWAVLLGDAIGAFAYYPWRFFFPAVCLSLTIFAFHLLGHEVQKATSLGGNS